MATTLEGSNFKIIHPWPDKALNAETNANVKKLNSIALSFMG